LTEREREREMSLVCDCVFLVGKVEPERKKNQ